MFLVSTEGCFTRTTVGGQQTVEQRDLESREECVSTKLCSGLADRAGDRRVVSTEKSPSSHGSTSSSSGVSSQSSCAVSD